MPTSHAISDLAASLKRIEAAGYDVTEITGSAKQDESDRARATVGLTIPVASQIDLSEDADLTIESAESGGDGVIDVELKLEIAEPLGESPGEDEGLEADGSGHTGSVRVESGGPESVPADSGDSGAAPGDDSAARTRNDTTTEAETDIGQSDGETDRSEESRPVYRDPDELRRVYDPAKTFPEMTEDLGVDVTAQTVRKYMVEHGIHDPASRSEGDADGRTTHAEETPDSEEDASGSDTAGGSDSVDDTGTATESDTKATATADRTEAAAPEASDGDDPGRSGSSDATDAIPDGIDCPADLTIDEVKRTVKTARTPYEVQRELGVDRGTTQQLLSALDLLDLVRSRMDQAESETSLETIESRIANATSD